MNLFDDMLAFFPMNEAVSGTVVNGVKADCHSLVNDQYIGASIVNPDLSYPITMGNLSAWGFSSATGNAVSFSGNSKSAAGNYVGFPAATVTLGAKSAPLFSARRGFSVASWIKAGASRPAAGRFGCIMTDYVYTDFPEWALGIDSGGHAVFSFYAPLLTLAGTLTGASNGVWVSSTKTLTPSVPPGWTIGQLVGLTFTIQGSVFVCISNTATSAVMAATGPSLGDSSTYPWTVNTQVVYTGTTVMATGSSHHIAFTWDGTTGSTAYTLYIDGVVDSQFTAANGATITPGGINNNQPSIGGYNDASGTAFLPFQGLGGMVGIWSRKLIQTEINGLADANNPIPQRIIKVLGGFNPGLTNPSWFYTLPAARNIAALNNLWMISPLKTVTDSPVNQPARRVWNAIYLLGYGGIDASGNAIARFSANETIVQALNQIATAGYGTASNKRTALLIPVGTYTTHASTSLINVTCPYDQISTHNCPFVDFIGQSALSTFIVSDRAGFYPSYAFNDNYPTMLVQGDSIVCHLTINRLTTPVNNGTLAQFTVTAGSDGKIPAGALTVSVPGANAQADTYLVTGGAGTHCVVSVTSVDGSGAVLTAQVDVGNGGSGFTPSTPVTLTLTINSTLYCIHDEPGFVGTGALTNVYYDLNLSSQTSGYAVGSDLSTSTNSFFICVNSDNSYNCHSSGGSLAPSTVMWNNCTVGLNPFTGARGIKYGVPPYGIQWGAISSTSADQITVIGCTLMGLTGDIYFNDNIGNENLYIDGNMRLGYIDPGSAPQAGDAYPSTNNITAGTGKVISGMGGIVIVATPPMDASVIFAQDDPNWTNGGVGNSLLSGVTVDDVVGSAVPPNSIVIPDARITVSGSGNSNSCYQDYIQSYRSDIVAALGGTFSPLMYVSIDNNFVTAYNTATAEWCVIKLAGSVILFSTATLPTSVIVSYSEVNGGGTASVAYTGQAADAGTALIARIRMRS